MFAKDVVGLSAIFRHKTIPFVVNVVKIGLILLEPRSSLTIDRDILVHTVALEADHDRPHYTSEYWNVQALMACHVKTQVLDEHIPNSVLSVLA